MELNELINKIYLAKKDLSEIEKQIKELTEKKKELETVVKTDREELLKDMTEQNIKTYNIEGTDIYAEVQTNESLTYQEKDVLRVLKGMGYDKFIKITESINKNDLKKELKENTTLSDGLKDYIYKSSSSYVVVTDKYEEMQEHIQENLKRSK